MEQLSGTGRTFGRSVFTSHTSKNFRLRDEIREFLEPQGISCWIAPRDIPAGQQYGVSIIEAIRQCAVTVKVPMEKSNQSKPAVSEIERTFSYRKTIILIRLREVLPASELEFFVANAQWVDAFSSPLEARIDEVARISSPLKLGLPNPQRCLHGSAMACKGSGQLQTRIASCICRRPAIEGLQDRL